MQEQKRCSKCGESRPVAEFYVQDKATGRLNPWCKACYRDWYRSRGGYSKHHERACEQCGITFVATRGDHRFCSAACKQRARTARRNPPKTTVCPVCSKSFDTVRPQVYCSTACAAEHRRRSGRGAHSRRKHLLKKKYGLTQEQFDRLLVEQGGCAICHSPVPNAQHNQWQIDHCHETGRVRGILCGPCNTGIGQMKDDPARLRAAADYLDKHT